MSQQQSLEYASSVLARVEKVRGEGKLPLVVLDLDLTLFDNRPRTRHILQDYIHSKVSDVRQQSAAMERLSRHEIIYSIQENMEVIGVSGETFRTEGLPFWMERFFSDHYCTFDVPYTGAPQVCRLLREQGAHLVYLTGRYADTQAVGTLRSLRHHGFPTAELGTHLIMKTSRQESDYAYKRRVAEELLWTGVPVAAVDNEPGHCNTMAELFPEADVAMFGNLHSPRAPELNEGIRRIDSWLPFLL